MVYQKDEYSTYKFASVFNALQNFNCGVFVIAHSDGERTDFYLGVRSFDDSRTTKSLRSTLKNALVGQFPGTKTEDLLDTDAENLLESLEKKTIAAVSCIANDKDEQFKDNLKFIQGLEKLALAMQGQKYTAIMLANGVSSEQIARRRADYEAIYSDLSPFENLQVNYARNDAESVSEAFSQGSSRTTTEGSSESLRLGRSDADNTSTTANVNQRPSILGSLISTIAGGVMGTTEGSTTGRTYTKTTSKSSSTTYSASESTNENRTKTSSSTKGSSESIHLTRNNRTIGNILRRIEKQLERIDECESMGMWESAAYFLSDSRETTEMAAGTYKALMRGENSGVEVSAINFWGVESGKVTQIGEYVTNLVHPVFAYRMIDEVVPVTAASLVSGNELAIQMGLPRKSVCGFPVIEHADFGKEIRTDPDRTTIPIGNVYLMSQERMYVSQLQDILTNFAAELDRVQRVVGNTPEREGRAVLQSNALDVAFGVSGQNWATTGLSVAEVKAKAVDNSASSLIRGSVMLGGAIGGPVGSLIGIVIGGIVGMIISASLNTAERMAQRIRTDVVVRGKEAFKERSSDICFEIVTRVKDQLDAECDILIDAMNKDIQRQGALIRSVLSNIKKEKSGREQDIEKRNKAVKQLDDVLQEAQRIVQEIDRVCAEHDVAPS